MDKILVTGCSGLVGIHITNQLLEKGYDVIGVDIKESPYLPDDKNFMFVNLDITDLDSVNILFDEFEFDGCINSFGIKGTPQTAKENPVDFLGPSIRGNFNIIDNCYKHNCWLVFMSSVGVYESAPEFIEDTVWKTLPSEHDWYPSWSKRVPELYLESYKIQHGWEDYTIVRPANIFGEYDNFGEWAMAVPANIKKIVFAEDEITAWGDGTPTRDFIYAGDVASATIKCLEDKLHITSNLGSGEEISIKRMIETIIKVSGKNIKVNWDISKPNGEPRRRMNTTIQEKYGLLPQTGFEQGIELTYNHYESRK
jgi:nucleoside-diphosphate-sugar epimerase